MYISKLGIIQDDVYLNHLIADEIIKNHGHFYTGNYKNNILLLKIFIYFL